MTAASWRHNPEAMGAVALTGYKLRTTFALIVCALVILFGSRKVMVHAMAIVSDKFRDAPALSEWLSRSDTP